MVDYHVKKKHIYYEPDTTVIADFANGLANVLLSMICDYAIGDDYISIIRIIPFICRCWNSYSRSTHLVSRLLLGHNMSGHQYTLLLDKLRTTQDHPINIHCRSLVVNGINTISTNHLGIGIRDIIRHLAGQLRHLNIEDVHINPYLKQHAKAMANLNDHSTYYIGGDVPEIIPIQTKYTIDGLIDIVLPPMPHLESLVIKLTRVVQPSDRPHNLYIFTDRFGQSAKLHLESSLPKLRTLELKRVAFNSDTIRDLPALCPTIQSIQMHRIHLISILGQEHKDDICCGMIRRICDLPTITNVDLHVSNPHIILQHLNELNNSSIRRVTYHYNEQDSELDISLASEPPSTATTLMAIDTVVNRQRITIMNQAIDNNSANKPYRPRDVIRTQYWDPETDTITSTPITIRRRDKLYKSDNWIPVSL